MFLEYSYKQNIKVSNNDTKSVEYKKMNTGLVLKDIYSLTFHRFDNN